MKVVDDILGIVPRLEHDEIVERYSIQVHRPISMMQVEIEREAMTEGVGNVILHVSREDSEGSAYSALAD